VHLLKLRVFNFRNLEEQNLLLAHGTNLFVGPNGQGKTNLLEAVYLLGYGKSFRTAAPRDCVRHGENQCCVEGTIEQGGVTKDLQVWIGTGEKKLLLHGKTVGIEEFAGTMPVLAFAHEHLGIIRGGPNERRSFLDRAMIALYPGHIHHLASYGRAVKQRNRLLSESRSKRAKPDETLLDSWDENLVLEGARIFFNRVRYVNQMQQELPLGLFGSDVFEMRYKSTIGEECADLSLIEAEFKRRLLHARPYDERMGFTSEGPHRDELQLTVNGNSLIDFGSAGQQRSCLLTLYFAQMEIHFGQHGYYPIFLVDDFEAELDALRLKTFLEYLVRRTQVFLTTARDGFFQVVPQVVRRFEIQRGTAHLRV